MTLNISTQNYMRALTQRYSSTIFFSPCFHYLNAQCFKNILFSILETACPKLLTRNAEFGKNLYISLNASHVVDFIKCLNMQLNLNGRKSLLYFQTLWVISGYTQKACLDGTNTLYPNLLLLFSNTGLNVCQMPPPPPDITYTSWWHTVTVTLIF